jgi:hypothetical protein
MSAEMFRLNTPTIALFPEGGRQVAHIVPEGSLIRVASLEGNGFIEVLWENNRILMFAQDVRSRGESVQQLST